MRRSSQRYSATAELYIWSISFGGAQLSTMVHRARGAAKCEEDDARRASVCGLRLKHKLISVQFAENRRCQHHIYIRIAFLPGWPWKRCCGAVLVWCNFRGGGIGQDVVGRKHQDGIFYRKHILLVSSSLMVDRRFRSRIQLNLESGTYSYIIYVWLINVL